MSGFLEVGGDNDGGYSVVLSELGNGALRKIGNEACLEVLFDALAESNILSAIARIHPLSEESKQLLIALLTGLPVKDVPTQSMFKVIQ